MQRRASWGTGNVLSHLLVLCIFCVRFSPLLGEKQCAVENGEITCKTCSSGGSINSLNGIPRVNRRFKSTSNDFGSYHLLNCPGDADYSGAGDACEFIELDSSRFIDGPKSEDDIVAYADSIGIYAIFAIVVAILTVFVGFLFCFCRCCCCCIKGGTCGKRYPTLGHGRLGFQELGPKGFAGEANMKQEYTQVNRVHYTPRGIWLSRLLMWTHVIVVAVFILVGEFKGNQGLTDGMKSIVDSPRNLVQVAYDFSTGPATNVAINSASLALAPAISNIKDLLMENFNLSVVASNTECILDSVDSSLNASKTILTDVRGLNSSLTDIVNMVGELNEQVANTELKFNTTQVWVGMLTNNLTSVVDTLDALPPKLEDIEEIISTTNVFMKNLTDESPYGYDVQSTATALDTIATGMPDQALAASVSGNLQDLTAHQGTAGIGFRNNLIADLQTENSSFSQLPNVTRLGLHLDYVNHVIGNFLNSNATSRAESALTDINDLFMQIPEASTFHHILNGLDASLNSTLELDPVEDLLRRFNSSVRSLPAEAFVNHVLNTINDLQNTFPCFDNILAELDSMNQTLVRLPKDLNEVTNIRNDLNGTLEDAKNQLLTFQQEFSNILNKSDDGLKDALKSLDDIASLKENVTGAIDFDALLNSSTVLQNSIDSYNSTLYLQDLSELDGSVGAPNATASSQLLSQLNSLQTVLDAVSGVLSDTLGEIIDFNATDRCWTTTSGSGILCTSDSDCSGSDTCQSGIAVCLDDTTVACTTDSDCGTSCSLDGTLVIALASGLDQYSSATLPQGEAASVSDSYKDMTDTLDSVSDLGDSISDVDNIKQSLESIPASDSLDELNDFTSELTPENIGFSSIKDQLDDIETQIKNANIADAIDNLDEVIDSFTNVEDYTDNLTKLKQTVRVLEHYLLSTLPSDLKTLDKQKLEAIKEDEGSYNMLLVLAHAADHMIDVVDHVSGIWDYNSTFSSTEDALSDYRSEIQGLTSPTAFNWGPYYYIFNVLGASTLNKNKLISPSEYQNGDSVYYDASGVKYPDDQICLHSACLDESIEQLNNKKFGDAPKAFGQDSSPMDFPLSREQLGSILFIVPAIICVLGLLSTLTWIPCGKRWTRIPSCLHLMCSCISFPFIILIAGGMLFPLTVMYSDACYGIANIGHTYVTGSAKSLCESNLGGAWVSHISAGVSSQKACKIEIDSDSYVYFPIIEFYEGVMGSCAGKDVIFADLYNGMTKAFETYPESQLNESVLNKDLGEEFAIQPALADLLRRAARNSSLVLDGFSSDMTQTVGCDALHSASSGFIDSMCCDVGGAIYWWVSSWYVIAFSILLCGFPASILGYKRFVKELWGPEYKEVQSKGGKLAISRSSEDDMDARFTALTSPRDSDDKSGLNPIYSSPFNDDMQRSGPNPHRIAPAEIYTRPNSIPNPSDREQSYGGEPTTPGNIAAVGQAPALTPGRRPVRVRQHAHV